MFKTAVLFMGILCCACGSASGEMQKKNWAVSIEAGTGNILGLGISRQNAVKRIDIGAGAGFNYKKDNIGEEKYNLLSFNGNVFSSFHFLGKNDFSLSGRVQAGFNALSAGKNFSTQSWDLTPGLIAGVKNIYAAFTCAFLFTKEMATVPQIGIGYLWEF